MKNLRWLPAAALLLAAAPTFAGSMRCGNKLVLKGDPQSKVLHFCGDPTGVVQRTVLRSGPTRYSADQYNSDGIRDEVLLYQRSLVEVVIEEWIYNLGPNHLMRQVIFENGLVREVATLDYGYHED